MSRWVVDIGNTRLKCAPLDPDGRLGQVSAIAHHGATSRDELASLLPARGDCAYVCSVVPPDVSLPILELLAQRFRCISMARSTPAFAGVRNAYADPRRLGVDRFLALVAARRCGPGAWLVCGVGTALTVDLLDEVGMHRGGRIGPSPQLMRAALHRAAPHLPAAGGHDRGFALFTEDALASGCMGAALGLIEHSLQESTRLLRTAPRLLLHGGGAGALAQQLGDARHEPALVLQGLAAWAQAALPPAASNP